MMNKLGKPRPVVSDTVRANEELLIVIRGLLQHEHPSSEGNRMINIPNTITGYRKSWPIFTRFLKNPENPLVKDLHFQELVTANPLPQQASLELVYERYMEKASAASGIGHRDQYRLVPDETKPLLTRIFSFGSSDFVLTSENYMIKISVMYPQEHESWKRFKDTGSGISFEYELELKDRGEITKQTLGYEYFATPNPELWKATQKGMSGSLQDVQGCTWLLRNIKRISPLG